MGDHGAGGTPLDRLQRWAIGSPRRLATISGVPVTVVLGVAAILAGLGPGVVLAVAVGGGLLVASTAVLVLWALNGVDPEVRGLSAAESAIVQRATSSHGGALAVAADPRLRAIAVRSARHRLLVLRRLRPVGIGIAVLMIATDVTLAVRGDLSSWVRLAAPVGIVAAMVSVPRRLRAVLDVLESPG